MSPARRIEDESGLLASHMLDRFVGAVAAPGIASAGFDAQAFNLLVKRGERDLEASGGLSLVPGGAFEHVHDDAPFDLLHDLKQRRSGVVRAGARAGFAR